MGRPITKPRLKTLDANQVALEVTTTALAEHESTTAALFAPAFTLSASNPELALEQRARKTRLFRTLRRLTEYAQQGGELERPLRDQLLQLLPVLQRQLRFGSKAALPDEEHPEPVDALLARMDLLGEDEALAIALRAAHARDRLCRTAEPLTASQLAVLASEARARMSTMISDGAVTGKKLRKGSGRNQQRDNPYLVEPGEALSFLASRDVPGLPSRRARLS